MNIHSKTIKQKGLSLVELMVSITIGLILIAGTIQIYVNSKQTYRVQNANSRVQENARFALSLLINTIRPAGFIGCANIDNIKPNIIAVPKPPFPEDLTSSSAVKGYEYTGSGWSPALPVGVTNVLPKTDVITVQHGGDCGASLTGNLAPNNANIQVTAPNGCGFKQDSILMISDCEAADIFRVVNNPTTGGTIQTVTHSLGDNNANVLSKLYQSDGTVYSFTSSSYFIRNNPAGVPSLYVKDHALDTAAFELIEGVENLQVAYGVDDTNDGVPERYVAANTVASASLWNRVVAVRLRVLMRTTDNVQARDFVDTDTTFSSFGAAAYTGGFMRKVFTTTIQLRNRALAL